MAARVENNKIYISWTKVSLAVVFVIVFLSLPWCVSTHGHSHEHDDEPPSFKYSRAANEEALAKAKQNRMEHGGKHESSSDEGVGHMHGHARSHFHSHEDRVRHDHGYFHDDHGHSHHAHAHSHSHSHGAGGHGHSHYHTTGEVTTNTPTLWLQAIGAVLLISAAPYFILFLIPLDNTKSSEPLLKVLLSFASGGLLGDAFLHLIPHALMEVKESAGNGPHDLTVGLWVLSGIVTFLMVEKFVRIVKGGHGHSHSHGVDKEARVAVSEGGPVCREVGKEKDSESDEDFDVLEPSKTIGDSNSSEDGAKRSEHPAARDDEDCKKRKSESKNKPLDSKGSPPITDPTTLPVEDIKVSGYLNLAADFTHNFTDGLAIGASFLAGQGIGVITTITILLHEVPHEIGDFAILIQSGCSRKRAMALQLITALGALTGVIVSLLSHGAGGAAATWVLPFTAGGFIYIATVSVLPELLEDSKVGQSFKEILALLLGVYMMVLIAEYE